MPYSSKEREQGLRVAEQELKKKEAEILETINVLEKDEALLRSREDEILQKVQEIDTDRKMLDDKEQELLDVIKKLDVKEEKIQKEMQAIKDYELKKEDIRQVKEELGKKKALLHEYASQIAVMTEKKAKLLDLQHVKEETEELEKTRTKLRREMEQERKELEGEINRLSSNAKELAMCKEMEQQILQREATLNKKEEALQNLYEALQQQASVLPAPASTAGRQLASEIVRSEDSEEIDIYSKIADARRALAETNLQAAHAIYRDIQQAYRGFRGDAEEKRKIYCDVMELKTDIELEKLDETGEAYS